MCWARVPEHRRLARRRRARRGGAARHRRVTGRGVLGQVRREQLLLGLLRREQEEDEDRTEQDRDQAGGVRPLVAVEERLLGGRRDLARVLRVLLRDALRAGERLRELALDAVADLLAVRRGGAGGGRRAPR